jgi:murein DD-endopeptidase MepM/ murein hydrolase activator NlpD
MIEASDTFLYKMRFLVGASLIILGILLLPVFLSMLTVNPQVHAANINSTGPSNDTSTEDSPNIITSGLFESTDKLGKLTNSATQNFSNGVDSSVNTVATAAANSGKFVAHGVGSGVSLTARGVGGGINLMAQGASGSFAFMVRSTGSVVGFIGKTPPVSVLIKPADKTPVPAITNGVTLAKEDVKQPAPAANTATPAPPAQTNTAAIWPIHGTITTYFGQSDLPFQRYHTGIDISDGKHSGITPIHPFKAGRVVEVIHSSVSLGNHVVIDHGGGITSVYGHMYSTAVTVGQQVDQNTILGYEGTTGASTGPHVHFEVRVNGQAVDPRKYVPGQP